MEIEIAIPSPLGQTFTYFHPEALEPGVRVKVLFGTQGKTIGVVLGSKADQVDAERPYKLKSISEVVDPEPAYAAPIIELARWMAAYYMHPIGEVLRTMLPASKTKTSKVTYELLGGPSAAEDDGTTLHPAPFFGRKRTVSLATLKIKLKDRGINTKDQQQVFRQWLQNGWVQVANNRDVKARVSLARPGDGLEPSNQEGSPFRSLNLRQQAAVDCIISEGILATPSNPFLIFGVTGSGKTEVFLNVLRSLISKDTDSQALVLVPEISLTPQMTKIFRERFPGIVAVVHSAMEDEERWAELNRIRSGQARVLIGPRSAVFGPFRSLKLIIVDEEHDGSYKQGSGLLYNARDVAVMRGRLEEAAVVLGSATTLDGVLAQCKNWKV